jgi:hypothetical protein
VLWFKPRAENYHELGPTTPSSLVVGCTRKQTDVHSPSCSLNYPIFLPTPSSLLSLISLQQSPKFALFYAQGTQTQNRFLFFTCVPLETYGVRAEFMNHYGPLFDSYKSIHSSVCFPLSFSPIISFSPAIASSRRWEEFAEIANNRFSALILN